MAGSNRPRPSSQNKETNPWHIKKQAVAPGTVAIQRAVVSASRNMAGKDHTIFATAEGSVKFHKGLKGRTFISVLPVAEAAE